MDASNTKHLHERCKDVFPLQINILLQLSSSRDLLIKHGLAYTH